MTRGGNKAEAGEAGGTPERRCLVSGEVGPKAGLIRFVVGPDGEVVPDILGKLPGRGFYVTASRPMLDEAKRGQFARAAKASVTVPDNLADEVERQLALRLVELVSLARKAGMALAGFEKVKEALARAGDGLGTGAWRRVRVLMQASDGSERGKSKLWTPEGARYYSCLTAGELGAAFGRQSVIHAVLASGALADRVVEEAAKLRGLRELTEMDGASQSGRADPEDTDAP